MQEPKSPWLEHLSPEQRDDSHAKDALRLWVEREVASLANRLVDEHGIERRDATHFATNLIVAQTLEVQREYAPDGYKSMLCALATKDPAIAELRSELLTLARHLTSNALRLGIAFASCIAVLCLMLGAGTELTAMIMLGVGGAAAVMMVHANLLRRRKKKTD